MIPMSLEAVLTSPQHYIFRSVGSCHRSQAGLIGWDSFPTKVSGSCSPSRGHLENCGSGSRMLGAVVTTLSLPPYPSAPSPLQVSWLGEEPVAGVWSEKGQVEVFALRRLLQVVDDPQAMATFLRDEQARVKPIFAFAGHMGEGFALDWSSRVPGKCLRWDWS